MKQPKLKRRATARQTFDLLNATLNEQVYCFELLMYNGFLNAFRKARFNIKTALPEAVTATDFKEKIEKWASVSFGVRAQVWECKEIKFIGRVGL